MKWEFSNAADDDWGLNESRGSACEFVAWQFLCHLDQRETIQFLLEELPIPRRGSSNPVDTERGNSGSAVSQDLETTPLLSSPSATLSRFGTGRTQDSRGSGGIRNAKHESYETSRYSRFFGLNALEIAAIAQAKRFLSQRAVLRVVNDIWNGEIVFWDSLTVHSTKRPHIFNRQ